VPDEGDGLPGSNGERNILQDPVVVIVGKPNVLKFDAAFGASALERLRRRRDQDRQIERLEDAI
jgi:hypothetical protein